MTLVAPPDFMLGSDGHLYGNVTSLRLEARVARRIIRCAQLMPGEEALIVDQLGGITGNLVLVLAAQKRGAR
ncbi:MAG: hypothetical protein ACMG6S_15555 [Byssovorax sp.]